MGGAGMSAVCTQPEVTDAHRRAAFAAMCWGGWTFESAMLFTKSRELIEHKAKDICRLQHAQQPRSVDRLPGVRLGSDGHPLRCGVY